tara:strand:- start:53 stop:1264 length:1212 start_codon:yes stop_codon:yes gene_type:complete
MKSFKQFILLTESKNTHLEHLEDEIWNDGFDGVMNAVKFVNGVADSLSSVVSSSHNVTVKWDGAPAIFVGINPENNKFFVGTKSVFNKNNPKINHTNADIDKNHPASGLNSKLKIALKYLPKLGIKKGILQGDFMFDSGSLGSMSIDGEKQTTFTPNTITYAVPVGSDLEKQIKSSKMGIVFHTGYKGKTIADMKAFFRPSLKSLKKTKDVWFRDADFTDSSGASTLTKSEREAIDSELNKATTSMSKVGLLADNIRPELLPKIKVYINSTIKKGISNGTYNDLVNHVKTNFDTAISKLKTEKGKEKKTAARDELLDYMKANKKELSAMFDVHKALSAAKLLLIRKLEKIKGIGTFIRTSDGFRATAPEGFVAVDKTGKALKLVDRLEFSRANFTVAKDWVKG